MYVLINVPRCIRYGQQCMMGLFAVRLWLFYTVRIQCSADDVVAIEGPRAKKRVLSLLVNAGFEFGCVEHSRGHRTTIYFLQDTTHTLGSITSTDYVTVPIDSGGNYGL